MASREESTGKVRGIRKFKCNVRVDVEKFKAQTERAKLKAEMDFPRSESKETSENDKILDSKVEESSMLKQKENPTLSPSVPDEKKAHVVPNKEGDGPSKAEAEMEELSPAMRFFMSTPKPEASNMHLFNDYQLERALKRAEAAERKWDARPRPPKQVAYPISKFLAEEYNPISDHGKMEHHLNKIVIAVGQTWLEIVESERKTTDWNTFVNTWRWLRYDTRP